MIRAKKNLKNQRKRCPRCNQLLRVKKNGELEPHMLPPSPRGEPGVQCLPPTSMTLYAPHKPAHAHLMVVLKKMRKLGAPRIKAVLRDSVWYALEGSHRIAAASHLGLMPVIIAVTPSQQVTHDTKDVVSRRAKDVLAYYDEHRWWVKYEFTLTKASHEAP